MSDEEAQETLARGPPAPVRAREREIDIPVNGSSCAATLGDNEQR